MAFKVDDQLIGQAGDEARRVWSRCYVDRRMGHHMRWAVRFFVAGKVPLPPTRHRRRPPKVEETSEIIRKPEDQKHTAVVNGAIVYEIVLGTTLKLTFPGSATEGKF